MTWKQAGVVIAMMAVLTCGAFVEGRLFERLSNAEMTGEQNAMIAAARIASGIRAILVA